MVEGDVKSGVYFSSRINQNWVKRNGKLVSLNAIRDEALHTFCPKIRGISPTYH